MSQPVDPGGPLGKAELYEFYRRGPECGWAEYLRPDGLPRLRPVRFRLLATAALAEDLEAPGRILDTGCGVGILLTHLLGRYPGARGVGADLALPHLARARQLAARQGVADRVDLVQSDLDHLAIQGRFDLVVATEVLEHLLDPAPALASLRACLGPRGRLLVSVPLRFPGDGVVYRQGEVETGDLSRIDLERPYERFFHRLYTLERARDLFASCGLAVERERCASFELPMAPELGDRLVRFAWMDRLLNALTRGRWARIGLYRLVPA